MEWAPYLEGSYESEGIFNGKPSWKSDNYAIWYSLEYTGWLIGETFYTKDRKNTGMIYASNDFSGVTDNNNQWEYINGNSWNIPSDPNDIQITCMDGKYNSFTILLYLSMFALHF